MRNLTKEQIENLLLKANELASRQSTLINQYPEFYFGSVSGFEIIYIDFEMVKYFFDKLKPKEIHRKNDDLTFDIDFTYPSERGSTEISVDFRTPFEEQATELFTSLKEIHTIKLR